MNLNTCDKKWVEDFWAKFEKKHEKSAVTQFTNIPYTTDENGKFMLEGELDKISVTLEEGAIKLVPLYRIKK